MGIDLFFGIDRFFDLISENAEKYDLFWRHEAGFFEETLKVWSKGDLIVSRKTTDPEDHNRLFYLASWDLHEWIRQQA